jgi:hypothetical protein
VMTYKLIGAGACLILICVEAFLAYRAPTFKIWLGDLVGVGDWGVGDWGLGFRGWGLGVRGWGLPIAVAFNDFIFPQSFNPSGNPTGEPRKIRIHRNTVAQSPVDEIATDFFPLTFAAETISSEGGHLVRVTIPRSVLVAMGLPMNVDRAAEHVRADVFIGDDGLARPIRFIQ